ncbi:lysine-specific demethylase JMJ30 isoform X1 [Oryza sativa Japonica Group]|nr:lysine-specific demethylase JMJ30 isoform X1 [Oryza sativa Japonica Group]XP_052165618.1 lysine-specific demethylase JMJ30-like isoform X1 [Oryza glaberrima]
MATGGEPRAAAAAEGGEKRAALLREITEEGGFAFVASAEKAAADGDLRAAEAAREMAWEQLHACPRSEVGRAWRDAYALACLHVAALRVAGGGGDGRRAALRALDMGLIMGGDLLRAELEEAIARVVADRSRGCGGGGGDGAGENGADVEKWMEGLTRKRDLADVLKVLPVKSLSCKQIERRSCISLEAFIRDYFLCESPVILSGYIDHWPARTKWKDIRYLERIAGDRTVPVEVGKKYLSSEWKQELITFSQFLEMMWSSDCSANLTYLAQHPLFDQIKELREDIMVPEYCNAGGGELQKLNAWFGPEGTVTPLHHDLYHNLFAQVLGRKYFRLYSASISNDLYPHRETMLSNISQVDLDNINVNEFPRTGDVEFMDGILEEGDLLYIPPKWWHYVRSLSTSFSVSFWWRTSIPPPQGS